ncbi:Radical SAM domain protein [Stanieria cyanosphaera PCC 7437]|uniref:7-carboxy-7-deazaguanine synthase n=1 Tax=Stanieria cyanosphaera (strain ATCC 29371 / PCC 7437) TaxID=111780 RepID=K9XVJ7_STAC7|nr:7-carboxy-7-deazaguanine synthase QueE [Stanieria cyanosphaera]AFZ36101.1 Radical SAM domain protein [Stanieria cyanosphaera PCC 7437]
MDTVTYPIVETFHSVQGEGAWTGVNAFFIRLGGCDVGCFWCDTKQSWNAKRHPQRQVQDLAEEVRNAHPAIAVITGGEPLMHNLYPLTAAIKSLGIRVHLETSGAHPFSGDFDWVTFSPKQFKPPHQSVYSHVSELKVVIAKSEDLIWAEQQASLVSPETLKYLQPEWNTPSSKDLIFEYILKHPQWRISLQTHKLLEVR